MARRKFISATRAFCACRRRRVWRQLAISIQADIPLSTQTSQNRPLPTRPCEVRQVRATRIRSLPTGETGTA